MRIDISFHETTATFQAGFEDDRNFDVAFEEGIPQARASPYTGKYEVIPRVTAQSLPTRDRQMERDVLIHAIPYHEVANTERGTTAIIGGI